MTDKIKDSIRNSMLDELLSDVDKPQPKVPARQSTGGYKDQGTFDWNKGDSIFDDDGPDPMDDGYHGHTRPTPKTRYTNSVFNRRTSHENVVGGQGDFARQVADLLRTVRRVGNNYLLETTERDELVAIMMKVIGVQLDQVGIVWGTEGVKAFRETLKDLVPMAYYGTTRLTVEDDEDFEDGRYGKTPDGVIYDRQTGEVFDSEEDFEERRAIMEENAGHE